MNKDTSDSELGELSQENFDFKQLTWKIPNVLSLPDIVGNKVQSPTFDFASATWKLQLYSYGKSPESEGHIDIVITRLHSHIRKHIVIYKLSLKTRKGKSFDDFSSKQSFNSNFNEYGAYGFMPKSKLVQMKNLLVPNDVLTVLCHMRTENIDKINRYSQLESTASFFGSDKAMESSHSMYFPDNQILSDFKRLLLSQKNCDVTIEVKGKEFQAHRLILETRSPVFALTFQNNMKEKSTGVIVIKDCDPSVFSDFLSFLYCGDVETLSVENVFGLFIVADKYDVQSLRNKCLQFIKANLSVDTFCDTMGLALQHSEGELVQLSTDFFAKELQKIIVTDKWESFLIENPACCNELFVKALVPNKSLK